MINRVVLVGRLCRDVELRRTVNGTPVSTFTIAVNRNFKSEDGENQADFIQCTCWNKLAENVAAYCTKGSLVGIDGRLQSRIYEDKNGNKRTVIEVLCETVQFLENKNKDQNKNQDAYNKTDFTNDFNIMNDDIPF